MDVVYEPENNALPNKPNQPNPTVTSPPSRSFEWIMVVKSVDSFVGGASNANFKNILLGIDLPNGLTTTSISHFNLNPDSDKVELMLQEPVDWTLWTAHGFYPITWEFTYLKTVDTMELEGFANMGLSDCEMPEGSTLVNRYYFSGVSDGTSEDKYVGRYLWEEAYETGTCIRIEGEMEVLKEVN